MRGFALDQGFGQNAPGGVAEQLGNPVPQRLDLGFELESEVAAAALDRETLVLPGAAEPNARGAERGVLPHEIVGQGRPLDQGAGTPKRSAKNRSEPATAPQLPATDVFETLASWPSAVCSSITRSKGMNRASSSAHSRRISFDA